MKKTLAVVLALVLTMAFSMSAMAEEPYKIAINLKTLSTIAEGLHLHPALLLTDLPQRMEEPVHQAIVGLYLLYSPLPLEEKKEFWGILHSLEAEDGCRPE